MKFPSQLANTEFELTLFGNGVSKTGGNIILTKAAGKCIFVEKSQVVIDSESKKNISAAYIIIKGDIAPKVSRLSNGEVVINGCRYNIVSSDRTRDRSGNVFSTQVYLK